VYPRKKPYISLILITLLLFSVHFGCAGCKREPTSVDKERKTAKKPVYHVYQTIVKIPEELEKITIYKDREKRVLYPGDEYFQYLRECSEGVFYSFEDIAPGIVDEDSLKFQIERGETVVILDYTHPLYFYTLSDGKREGMDPKYDRDKRVFFVVTGEDVRRMEERREGSAFYVGSGRTMSVFIADLPLITLRDMVNAYWAKEGVK